MPFEVFLSLVGLAIAAAWTPGPNNALVASSGARFGFRRTIPHISGIGLGYPVMIFCIAIGLGQLFQTSQLLREVVRYVGVAVLLWLAWKIANSTSNARNESGAKPFTFFQGAAFQWVNPKSWVMAISISAQYVTAENPYLTSVIVAAVFIFCGFSSASAWTWFGTAMQRILNSPRKLRVFNIVMALTIVASVVPIAISDLT